MRPTIRKILLPTNFGPSAERTAASAAALARGFGASLHLLHVTERPSLAAFPWPRQDSAPVRERLYHEGRARLAALAAGSVQATDRITLEVRTGPPAKAIVDAAVDYGADLIVMSAPARSGVPKLATGSVVERVLQAAPCPVVVIKQSGAAWVHAGKQVA